MLRHAMRIRLFLDVPDIDRAIGFYTEGLGFTAGRRRASVWAELMGSTCPVDLLLRAASSVVADGGWPPHAGDADHRPPHLNIVVTGLATTVARLVALGATVDRPPAQWSWGRMACLTDPFGHGIDLLEFHATTHPAP